MIFNCLFTISAVCLQFSNVNNQLFVYFFEFSSKNIDFCKVFCQNVEFKRFKIQKVNKQLIVYIVSCLFTLSAVCLHCQLFVCLFTFSNFQAKQVFCHDKSLNSWFSAVCLFTLSAVCLQFFQLFVYIFKNLNFRAKT